MRRCFGCFGGERESHCSRKVSSWFTYTTTLLKATRNFFTNGLSMEKWLRI